MNDRRRWIATDSVTGTIFSVVTTCFVICAALSPAEALP